MLIVAVVLKLKIVMLKGDDFNALWRTSQATGPKAVIVNEVGLEVTVLEFTLLIAVAWA